MARSGTYERRTDFAAPVAFAIFVALGAAYILLAKLYLNAGAFLVTAVPCLLMLGYAGLVLVARRLRLREDQSADNFYYMGFIFTLISLAISLYQYGTEGSLETIVRNFGVAIASTITGIILRILFNQMRRDPVEIEQYSRLDLAEASNRVRRELDGVVMEFQHFRRTNQQMLAESFSEIREEVLKTARDGVESSRALTNQVLEATRAANGAAATLDTSNLKAEVDQATKSLRRITSAIGKASDQIEKSAGAFTRQLSLSTTFEDRLQPLLEGLDRSIKELNRQLEAQTGAVEKGKAEIGQTVEIDRDIARVLAEEDPARAAPRSGLFRMFRRSGEPEA